MRCLAVPCARVFRHWRHAERWHLSLGFLLFFCLPCAAGIARAVCHEGGLSARMLWVDATSNLRDLDSMAHVQALAQRARRAHLNTLVVDVKPIVGEVLYPSTNATHLTDWLGQPYPAHFDLLAVATTAGHAQGLAVYASLNVLSEGHRSVGRGLAYEHPDWQTVNYEARRQVVAGGESYPLATENRAPGADALAVYTARAGATIPVQPGALYAVYRGRHVDLRLPAEAAEGGTLAVPSDGGVLAATGSARAWLQRCLAPGAKIAFHVSGVLVRAVDGASDRYAIFCNPLIPAVRRHELAVIREVAACKSLDGIVFDRLRYPGLYADFSDRSRRAFEAWLRRPVARWPEDVYRYASDPGLPPIRGPLFQPWLQWRATVIRDFLAECATAARQAHPGIRVGVYVGSWYSTYYQVGVNWGSPRHPVPYDWASPGYAQTGYADQLDFLCAGTYYPRARKSDAPGEEGDTVEGAADAAEAAVDDATFTYASLYLIQYAGHPQALRRAAQAALDSSEGLMVFDTSYVTSFDWWSELASAVPAGGQSPDRVPGLLKHVRALRAILDKTRPPNGPGTVQVAPAARPGL